MRALFPSRVRFCFFTSFVFSLVIAQCPAMPPPGTLGLHLQPGGSAPITTWVRTGAGPFASMPSGVGITNGDFAQGLASWRWEELGGSAAPGSVVVTSGEAQLLEGDSFLVSLHQTFLLPAFATTLQFDVLAQPGFDQSASFIPDAFEMSLLDPAALPALTPWMPGATSSFNLQEDGTTNLAPEVSWNGTTVTVDLSAVSGGQLLTLIFDYVNADVDTAGGVRVDNVTLTVSPGPESFLRGDMDGDALRTVADEGLLLDLVLGAGAIPPDCSGVPRLDAADGNDNEFITIADYLRLRRGVTTGAVLPAPDLYCDLDPDDDLRGFDLVDSAFKVTAGDVELVPPTGATGRDVFIPVLLDVPDGVTGLTLVLEYDASVLTPFDPALGEGEPFDTTLGLVASRSIPGTLVISNWATNDGDALLSGAPGIFQEVGILRFHLADFAILPPFTWAADTGPGPLDARATVVDLQFEDHQPELLSGVGQFVRGNSNDDASVNLSDAVYTLAYLFTMGTPPPCLDAADADNDSAINIADPVFTLNYLFSMGTVLPPPFPDCGNDSGPIDPLDCSASSVCQP